MYYKFQQFKEDGLSLEIFQITINRNNSKLEIKSNCPEIESMMGKEVKEMIQLMNGLFKGKLYKPNYLIITDLSRSILDNISIIRTFDFDTRALKKPSSKPNEKFLIETGENLVNRLQHILSDDKKKKSFMRMYKAFLPFIEDADIKMTQGDYYSLYINEKYNDTFTPPDLISDGTIGIIAIITALYFENLNIGVIEEPEKYIHPEIVRKIADSIDDVSVYKQIIITTHSSELLKHIKNIMSYLYLDLIMVFLILIIQYLIVKLENL
ncbi:MAG: ATP-binding protein [Candidatus Heimdallarchaeota archaeon]|nr:ATP-binding protein [Candidatus Heimdallarchaeota archaeon]